MLTYETLSARYAHIDLSPLDGMLIQDAWRWVHNLKTLEDQAYALVQYDIAFDSKELEALGRSIVQCFKDRPDWTNFPALVTLQRHIDRQDAVPKARRKKLQPKEFITPPVWHQAGCCIIEMP